jgi:ATP-dependent protease ClpP protease subunit
MCLTRIPDPADWMRTVDRKRSLRGVISAGPWNGPAPVIPRLADKEWFKLTNLGGNAADLWIYDEIGGWGVTAQNLVSELSELNVANITVHLNSPGGDVFDGIAITNALRDHPAKITVKVDALAASIASVIAQAADEIVMGRNSMMMIHNASGFVMGEAEDMEKMAALLRQTTENIASIYTERAGGKKDDWLAAMNIETWYTAEQAVDIGLADRVAPLATERDAQAAAAKFQLTNYRHAPKMTVPEPEPSPEPVTAWDPAAFQRSIQDALPQPVSWDPGMFRSAIDAVVNDAPAGPTPKNS